MPEEGVFGGPMGDGVGVPEAESFVVIESSGEMMGGEVGQGDRTILQLPEAELPVRHEVRVQSTRRSPSGADSGAQKRAVKPTRVTWLPQTKRHPHPRKGYPPRPLLLPHRQEPLHHQPQLDFPLPEVDESSLPEGCHPAGAEGVGGPLHPFVQAGALQPNPWLLRSHPQVLCHQVRNL